VTVAGRVTKRWVVAPPGVSRRARFFGNSIRLDTKPAPRPDGEGAHAPRRAAFPLPNLNRQGVGARSAPPRKHAPESSETLRFGHARNGTYVDAPNFQIFESLDETWEIRGIVNLGKKLFFDVSRAHGWPKCPRLHRQYFRVLLANPFAAECVPWARFINRSRITHRLAVQPGSATIRVNLWP
jgi:hypothetical protein